MTYLLPTVNTDLIQGILGLHCHQSRLSADDRMGNMDNLKFVLDHLKEIKYIQNLDKHTDFNKMGLNGLLKMHPLISKKLKNQYF